MTYVNNNFNIFSSIVRTSPINFRGVNSAQTYNIPAYQSNDSFKSNDNHVEFYDKSKIESLASSNLIIMSELKQHKIPLKVNLDELQKLKSGHMTGTYITAAKIYSALQPELKQDINKSDLFLAAKYHDYGKALIPKSILNKEGALNDKEKEIMNLHSLLGAELLKPQGLSDKTLSLIKYHHQNPQGNGYPAIENDFEYGLDSEILAAADKYSALTEKRSYKNALTKQEALDIIQQDVYNNNLSPDVYEALRKSV